MKLTTIQRTCIHCGGKFFIPTESYDLWSEGFIQSLPDSCTDCVDLQNNPSMDNEEEFSDADCGL